MADSYVSGQTSNYSVFSQPIIAATVYEAEESSLFLGGQLIPMVNTPSGVLNVPELASVTATTISGGGITTDVANTTPAATSNVITADLIAARAVVRDLGGIDPNEIGRSLGKAVGTAFDKAVYAAFEANGTDTTYDTVPLTVDDVYDATQLIREAGEMGELYGILTPQAATEIQKLFTSDGTIGANFAGGDFQSRALTNGFVSRFAGVTWFMTANIADDTATSGYIFGADAARIAMQKNVDVEIARRAEAVGNDVVASLHAGVSVIDAARVINLKNV